ncbi:MAG: NAD(+) diphosphatase [Rhodospirillales bacterium]
MPSNFSLNLTYTTLSLRRDNMSRRPPDWLAERMAGGFGVVPVLGSKNLIVTGDAPQAFIFEGDTAQRILDAGGQEILLGTDDHKPVFAVSVDDTLAEQIIAMTGGAAEFVDLRTVGPFLPPADAHILAHARGMAFWHSRHGHCGVCGAPTQSQHSGHERKCVNPDCGTSHFPRTDPAIIVLVYRTDIPGGACLLGRHARWPFGMYSTLAGFVEPGETLEQAVSREVFEEAGIETTNVTYMASQPWPFPSSLMLGFHAEATSFDITIDDDELSDCKWFTRDDIRGMKEWLDAKDDDIRLPRRDSISRWLIQQWFDAE